MFDRADDNADCESERHGAYTKMHKGHTHAIVSCERTRAPTSMLVDRSETWTPHIPFTKKD